MSREGDSYRYRNESRKRNEYREKGMKEKRVRYKDSLRRDSRRDDEYKRQKTYETSDLTENDKNVSKNSNGLNLDEYDFVETKFDNTLPPNKQILDDIISHNEEIIAGDSAIEIVQNAHDNKNSVSKLFRNPLDVEFEFGDSGSSYRMRKLKRCTSDGTPDEETILKWYPTVIDFSIAQEEQAELDRAKKDSIYQIRKKPVGEFVEKKVLIKIKLEAAKAEKAKQQKEDGTEEPTNVAKLVEADLNKLRADVLKAKLTRAPNFTELEKQYNELQDKLKIYQAKQLRNEEPVKDETNITKINLNKPDEELTAEQLLLKEKLTSAKDYDYRNVANITKDSKYANDLDYIDESLVNLSNLNNIKNSTFSINKNIDDLVRQRQNTNNTSQCIFCLDNDVHINNKLAISVAEHSYVALNFPDVNLDPSYPESFMILPIAHKSNSLYLDEDEQEEFKKYMISISKYYFSLNFGCVFYESFYRLRRRHCAVKAVPVPLKLQKSIKGYFKNEILQINGSTLCDLSANHKLLIDTDRHTNASKKGYRQLIAKESEYFHVWLTLEGGYGHIIESDDNWPVNEDLFAKRVIGGALGVDKFDIEKKIITWNNIPGGIRRYSNDDIEGEGQELSDRNLTRVDRVQSSFSRFDFTLDL